MKYESVQQAREALKKLEQTQAAYNHALGVLYLDATTAAPSDTWEGRGKTMEVMSQITYDLLVNDENDELLSYLEAHADELDAQTKREVEVLRKSYDQIHRIPAEEYVAYSVLINDAESVWHKASRRTILLHLPRIWKRSWTITGSLPGITIRKWRPTTRC